MTLCKNRRGASLLEIMVAVLLFAIGITALLRVYTVSATMSKRAQLAYTAYNLSKSHVERLKTMAFSTLSTAGETLTRIDAEGNPDTSGDYTRTTTVTTSYNGDSNLTRIDVSVWYYFRGTISPSSMDITTVVFNGG